MSNLVPVKSQMPAHLQALFGGALTAEETKEFSGGVQAGFPILSIRGKVWRVKKGGVETPLLNDRDEAVQSVDVVLVQSSPVLAKIFYDKKYQEGDSGAPRCWSGNGVRPDSGVQNPISKACAACPNNAWGSRITEEGKKSRACGDNRRMAVVSIEDLDRAVAGEIDDIHSLAHLLRVPPASLNPLKDFVEGGLAPKGIKPYAIFVRIGFDTTAASPKLTFKPCKHPTLGTPFLTAEHAQIVMQLRNSEQIKRILAAELEEYSAAGTTDNGGEVAQASAVNGTGAAAATAEAPASAPAASPKPAKKKAVRPAAEEEIAAASAETVDADEDILAGAAANVKMAPAPKPAATDEEEDILATPPAAPAKAPAKKKAAAPATAAPAPKAAAPAPAAAAAVTEDEPFEDMLASILNS